jgi:glycerol uptake facilitator protein
MSPFLGELVGTACLVLLGDALIGRTRLRDSEAPTVGEAGVVIGWSAAAFVGCLLAAGHSAAHLNPAVTVGMWSAGFLGGSAVPSYLSGQLLGALLGAAFAWIVHLPNWSRSPGAPSTLACFCAVPPVRAPLGNLLGSVIGSFVVVLAFLVLWGMMATPQAPEVTTRRALPWAIGSGLIVLAASACLGAGITLGLNPARDIGGRAVHALLPIPGKGGSDWGTGGIAVVGAMVGSSLAAWTFRLLAMAAT